VSYSSRVAGRAARAGPPEKPAVVAKIEEMGAVAVAVVSLAGVPAAVRFPGEFPDDLGGGGCAQKGRNLRRQGLDGQLSDQAVPGRTPGQGVAGERQGRGQGAGKAKKDRNGAACHSGPS